MLFHAVAISSIFDFPGVIKTNFHQKPGIARECGIFEIVLRNIS